MNFLAHYFFDHQENPYFNLGLLMPDLVRNFSPGSRLKISNAISKGAEETFLLQGCVRHAESDKVFHAWAGFHEMMQMVTSDLRKEDESIKKDWFIAHIAVELVMDHFLILRHPNLAKRLYTDFELLDMVFVQSFQARNHLPNFEQFEAGFNHFMKIRYLEKYQETASIIYALGRICTKVKLPPFTEGQKKTLEAIITRLKDVLPNQLTALQKELT